MDKIKEWKSGEEFVFDGVKKVPLIGAVYATGRTLTYGLMGNKSQSINSAKGFVDNVKDTTGLAASLAIAPVRIASNAGGNLINKWPSSSSPSSEGMKK